MAYEYLPSVYFTTRDANQTTTKPSNKGKEGSILYQVLEPVLLLLRIFGRFPYAINPSPKKAFHCGWAAYSATIGVVQCCGLYFTSHVAYKQGVNNFDSKIFSTVTIIISALLGVTPFLTWVEARWMSAYLDKWTAYQEELRSFEVTLDKGLHKWLLIWIFALFPYTGTLAYFLDVRGGNPLAFPIYLIMKFGGYLLLTLWFFLVFFIEHAASRLLVRIREATVGREIANVKKLWLTLSNLTVELGQVLSLSLMLFMANCSIVAITSSYSLLFFLRDCFIGNCKRSSDINVPIINQIVLLFAALLGIITICEYGHRCTISVGSNFLKEILKINFSLKNENTQRELHSLVQTIMLSYPDMALGGYFTVNRRLLATMSTSAITYLIVLLQFRTSDAKK